eukprot:1831323-Rhodomonas_salina.1
MREEGRDERREGGRTHCSWLRIDMIQSMKRIKHTHPLSYNQSRSVPATTTYRSAPGDTVVLGQYQRLGWGGFRRCVGE